eukprot:scaffold146113_cov22-Tisochrysis_lutea.AAC.1
MALLNTLFSTLDRLTDQYNVTKRRLFARVLLVYCAVLSLCTLCHQKRKKAASTGTVLSPSFPLRRSPQVDVNMSLAVAECHKKKRLKCANVNNPNGRRLLQKEQGANGTPITSCTCIYGTPISMFYLLNQVETAGDCYIVSAGVLSSNSCDGFSHTLDRHSAPEASARRVMEFAKAVLQEAAKVIDSVIFGFTVSDVVTKFVPGVTELKMLAIFPPNLWGRVLPLGRRTPMLCWDLTGKKQAVGHPGNIKSPKGYHFISNVALRPTALKCLAKSPAEPEVTRLEVILQGASAHCIKYLVLNVCI